MINFTTKGPFDYFEKCNFTANSHPNTWIGGYPEHSGSFLANNELFDNILLKKSERGYEIIAFDWTFGTIDAKKSKAENYSKIEQFFKKVSIQESINLTIYIVAPKYIALEYARENKKEQFFAYSPEKPIDTPNINHRYTYKLAYFDENLPFTSVTN